MSSTLHTVTTKYNCDRKFAWLATIATVKHWDIVTVQVHLWSVILMICTEIDRWPAVISSSATECLLRRLNVSNIIHDIVHVKGYIECQDAGYVLCSVACVHLERQFYKCNSEREGGCDFFLWADQAPNSSHSNTLLNSTLTPPTLHSLCRGSQ